MVNNKKLLVFDVDGTLTPHGVPIGRGTAEALCELERRGHTVAFASGKTTEYLDGLARGIGLASRCLIAENGAVLYLGEKIHLLAERPAFFDRLQHDIVRLFPQARLQHNMVNLTALTTGDTLEAVVAHLKSTGMCDGKSCRFYLHSDSAELLPQGVDKGRALHEVKRLTGCAAADVIAAGNAENDKPMRSEAGIFLSVGDQLEADRRFEDAPALMAYLLAACI